MNISQHLNLYIDNNYKLFHQKICSTNYEILGIKIPILRKIAKELLKTYSFTDILKSLNNNYYEHIMLEGLIIANANICYEEKINLINEFISKIDNWATCDVFCSELKMIKKNKNSFLDYINPFFDSNEEYYQRFAIVILIDYYINDEYIELVLNKMINIKSDYYYVKMAISWCLSICLIKYYDMTIKFLNDNKNNIDKWTYNKALQKGIESYRMSASNKKTLQNMKIK